MKGTVIKRGSRWSVVIDLGRDVDGKRLRKWHSGYRTKREAEQARIEILSRVQSGLYVAPHKLTVAQWLRDWLEGRVGLAETTIEGYQRDAARVADRIGQQRLSNVSTGTLNSLYRDLGETLAPATVKYTHAVVHKTPQGRGEAGHLGEEPGRACRASKTGAS
jgi:hypothetical protein